MNSSLNISLGNLSSGLTQKQVYGLSKVEGYNAGMTQAVHRFEYMVLYLAASMLLNVFLVRWIRHDQPWELEKLGIQIPDKYLWKISNALTSGALLISVYMALSLFIDPYQVTT